MTQFDELVAPQAVRQPRAGANTGAEGPTTLLPPGPASILHLQRTAGNAAVVARLAEEAEAPDAERPITKVVSGGGTPLDRGTRTTMESAFGHDFSDVRIHDDAAATDAAHDVAAKAATVGNHIVFRSGEFDPGSAQGQHLLAHELTHVVQQRSGPVDGTAAGGGVRISDPSDRFEMAAEANASRITSQLSAEPAMAGVGARGEGSVQRQESGEEEGEEMQLMADPTLQREGEEEETEGEE